MLEKLLDNQELVEEGIRRIEWVRRKMPVLTAIAESWQENKPLAGLRVAACLHVTTKTANLVRTLKDGGAEVALCASNPLSTQDDVVAALNCKYKIPTYAYRGVDRENYYRHIKVVLDTHPQVTIDDGADLVNTVHTDYPQLIKNIVGGTEETTTGVIRLRAMAADGALRYPIIAVNAAKTKHMFDNRYGTGQSSIDGLLRATNYLLAGSSFVVVGYGWCGKGIASRARGMGAHVTVVEVDPFKALEAVMDGFEVTSMAKAASAAEWIVTATGDYHVLDRKHLEILRNGAILANAGHFNVEINLDALREMATEIKTVRENIEEYKIRDGRRIYVVAEGRLVNLAAGEGHPAEVMDLSFANQALSVEYLKKEANLENKVYTVPEKIDDRVARLKLVAMGIEIEDLTEEQEEYLRSWQVGT